MDLDFYISLIYQDLKGEINGPDKEKLTDFLSADKENLALYDDIKLSWNLSAVNMPELDVEADLSKTKLKLEKAKRRSLMSVLMRVAAGVLIVAIAGFLLRKVFKSDQQEIIVTADQDRFEFDLPDGSSGWLQKGSSLTYHIPFKYDRDVILKGAGEFEVTHDASNPFVVQSDKARIEVLGTKFIVNGLNNRTLVNVINGRVSVKRNGGEVILSQNEIAICEKGNDVPRKLEMSIRNLDFWKYNQMKFANEPLSDIVQQLELIFDTQIKITNQQMEYCPVTLVINDIDLKVILQKISDHLKMNLSTPGQNEYQLDEGSCD